MTARTLTEIANTHGSDKGTTGPSAAWGGNNYTDIYEAYFSGLRNEPINILEIGLGVTGEAWQANIVHGRNSGGASLKSWYDYFPKAAIYGADINACAYLDNERTQTHVVDQGSSDSLRQFLDAIGPVEFDIVIDDGSHRPDHQQTSFAVLFERVKPGGLYIIEDLDANGVGDGKSGRSANNTVRNTRGLLKQFRDTGCFAGPHALGESGQLAGDIASVCFHSPKPSFGIALRPHWLRPFSIKPRYCEDSELICVIRKREQAPSCGRQPASRCA